MKWAGGRTIFKGAAHGPIHNNGTDPLHKKKKIWTLLVYGVIIQPDNKTSSHQSFRQLLYLENIVSAEIMRNQSTFNFAVIRH